MKVNKKRYMGIHRSESELFYVYLHRPNIRLSAGVRDLVLPHNYVYLETCENGDFYIIPTENEDGYKVTITNGQAKLSCCGLLREMAVIERVRITCEKLNGGKILCKASTKK